MPTGQWRIDLDSEARVLIPWLDSRPDPETQAAVLRWLDALTRDPIGRGTEDRPGLFSEELSGTGVAVAWTLDHDRSVIHLLLLG